MGSKFSKKTSHDDSRSGTVDDLKPLYPRIDDELIRTFSRPEYNDMVVPFVALNFFVQPTFFAGPTYQKTPKDIQKIAKMKEKCKMGLQKRTIVPIPPVEMPLDFDKNNQKEQISTDFEDIEEQKGKAEHKSEIVEEFVDMHSISEIESNYEQQKDNKLENIDSIKKETAQSVEPIDLASLSTIETLEQQEKISMLEPTVQPAAEPSEQPAAEPSEQPAAEPTIQSIVEPTTSLAKETSIFSNKEIVVKPEANNLEEPNVEQQAPPNEQESTTSTANAPSPIRKSPER